MLNKIWSYEMLNVTDVEFIKLKAETVDTGHLKLATWGTIEE